MRRNLLGWIGVTAMLVGSTVWVGCGDDETTTIFSGNVSSVSGASAALTKPKESRFALHWPEIPAQAYAQGTCGANGHLLFCVQTTTFGACERVNSECTFELETGIERERDTVVMTFVNDTNGNGDSDQSEQKATVTQNLRYCNGDRVKISDAQISFTSHLASATVTKTVDRCSGLGPTSTPGAARTSTPSGARTNTPSGSVTPTRTGTQYVAAAPLNQPPSSMLAFLFSAGAMGLLLPRRRRQDDRK